MYTYNLKQNWKFTLSKPKIMTQHQSTPATSAHPLGWNDARRPLAAACLIVLLRTNTKQQNSIMLPHICEDSKTYFLLNLLNLAVISPCTSLKELWGAQLESDVSLSSQIEVPYIIFIAVLFLHLTPLERAYQIINFLEESYNSRRQIWYLWVLEKFLFV